MIFRELKARKAKFGFNFGTITLSNVVQIGKFIGDLQTIHDGKYIADDSGFKVQELKIYTDDEIVAKWIRNYPFN